MTRSTLLKTAVVVGALGCAGALMAQNSIPVPKIEIGVGASKSKDDVSASLQILALLTVLSIAPSILMMMTAFTRIVIVLSFLRTAIGTPTIPPNQVLIGLALFLTFYVMAPVIDQINRQALQPYSEGKISFDQALAAAEKPIKEFMLRQTYDKDLALFIKLGNKPQPKGPEDLSLMTVIPAFITSELKTAFIIGFYIYIPFLVIDLVVASTLMSMGMMMLPPTVVSLPAKILVFLLADGWTVLVGAIANGFR